MQKKTVAAVGLGWERGWRTRRLVGGLVGTLRISTGSVVRTTYKTRLHAGSRTSYTQSESSSRSTARGHFPCSIPGAPHPTKRMKTTTKGDGRGGPLRERDGGKPQTTLRHPRKIHWAIIAQAAASLPHTRCGGASGRPFQRCSGGNCECGIFRHSALGREPALLFYHRIPAGTRRRRWSVCLVRLLGGRGAYLVR